MDITKLSANYFKQIDYAKYERGVIANMIRTFNERGFKSVISTTNDEIEFHIFEEEKEKVIKTLKELGFYSADVMVSKAIKQLLGE